MYLQFYLLHVFVCFTCMFSMRDTVISLLLCCSVVILRW